MKLSETPAVVSPEPSWNTTDLLQYRLRESPDLALFGLPEGDR